MIKSLVLLALAAGAARAAAPSRGAAAPSCYGGVAPRLNGDLFAPVECSSATLPVADLPVPPVAGGGAALSDLAGRWEGSAIAGFGRYELLGEVGKTGWTGRVEAALKLKELQFRTRAAHALKLVPARGKGRYKAELSTESLPGAVLKGEATLGVVASTGPDAGPRELDLAFENGALYRVRFAREGADALRVRLWSAIPGAPARSLETVLQRTTRRSP